VPTLAELEQMYLVHPGAPTVYSGADSEFEFVVDSVPYYSALGAAMTQATGPGDAIYLAGWLLKASMQFGPVGNLGQWLAQKARDGVDVRIVLWCNPWMTATYQRAWLPVGGTVRENVISALQLRRADPGQRGVAPLANRVLLDWSGSSLTSHHQKTVVVVTGNEVIGFASGIDVGAPFATPGHVSGGWHDASCRITGPAAVAVWDNFAERWAEAAALPARTGFAAEQEFELNPAAPPAMPPTCPVQPPQRTTQTAAATSVQVLRTIPDHEVSFAESPWVHPRTHYPEAGITETWLTYREALAAAEHYVYLEDQYIGSRVTGTNADLLLEEIMWAAKRGTKVILVGPEVADADDTVWDDGSLAKMLGDDDEPQHWWDNLAVWSLTGIYVHSKVLLVDDEFIAVGSANFMNRSMLPSRWGMDTELQVAAVATNTLVRDVRVELWGEHLLGLAPGQLSADHRTELADLDTSLRLWRPDWGTTDPVHTGRPVGYRYLGPGVAP
jgi:phosphatidylserine/phosphatidylglycerophosphate/cardiolipin synthase-like enzyme